nr:CpaF family protein [Rhodospirillales bacterium]
MDLKNRIQGFSRNTSPQKNKTVESDKTLPIDINHNIDNKQNSLQFNILSGKDMIYRDQVHAKLLDILDLSLIVKLDETEARAQISDISRHVIDDLAIPVNSKNRQLIINEVVNEILAFGPLEHLLHEPSIADILVNGPNSVYIERFGKLEKTPITFRDNEHLLKIIDRIVTGVGRRIDESFPLVDARLKDGSRVNAIIPPLAIDGPSLSIRRFTQNKLKLKDLEEAGSINPAMSQVFSNMIKTRLNILISGGTGSGKTTLLNALSNDIPNTERIVTIEDSAELQLQQEHIVRLETRPANIEGKGEVNQRDLIKNALRMRPDRILIGEVRGKEAFDMLQAMNTGHDGSITTVHANTPRDSLARVENMVSMAELLLPIIAIRSQIASAIDVVIQLERMEDGHRRVTSLSEINSMEGDIITMSEIFKFERRGLDENGNVIGQHISTGIVPRFHDRMLKRGLETNIHLYTDQSLSSV